jgi:hypothetical protein
MGQAILNERACVRGRRHFIRIAAAGLVSGPLTSVLFSESATAAELVSESDPKAVALKYKADATKSPDRKDPAAICDNCNLYTGKPGAATGACAALEGRLVAAKGWCTAWEGY